MNAQIEKLVETIDTHIRQIGWSFISVHGTESTPAFAYSIGFTETFGSPEVILCGFSAETSHMVIGAIARELKAGHLNLDAGPARFPGILKGFEIGAKPVDPAVAGVTARLAARRCHPRPVSLVQVFLPDEIGRLPDDPGCDERYRSIQDLSRLVETAEPVVH